MQPVNKEDYQAIDQMLDKALEEGFEVEMIYWALVAMKKDPNLTPSEAIALGVIEWVGS